MTTLIIFYRCNQDGFDCHSCSFDKCYNTGNGSTVSVEKKVII